MTHDHDVHLHTWHVEKRRQGWRCKIGGQHDGPCPMLPVWYRHPIIWWRMM